MTVKCTTGQPRHKVICSICGNHWSWIDEHSMHICKKCGSLFVIRFTEVPLIAKGAKIEQ